MNFSLAADSYLRLRPVETLNKPFMPCLQRTFSRSRSSEQRSNTNYTDYQVIRYLSCLDEGTSESQVYQDTLEHF